VLDLTGKNWVTIGVVKVVCRGISVNCFCKERLDPPAVSDRACECDCALHWQGVVIEGVLGAAAFS
jgi:hypothetical protein